MAKILSTEYIEIYFDVENYIYSWKFLPSTKNMNDSLLKETFILMTGTMQRFLPKFVLANDIDNYAVFPKNMLKWIAKITVESLIFSKTEKFAVLMPQDKENYLATKQAVEEAMKITNDIEIKMFDKMDEVKKWLK